MSTDLRSISTLLVMVLAAGCDRVLLSKQTRFSQAYSENQFAKIKPGMTVQEVGSLMGNPLLQTTQNWSEIWYFWPPQPSQDRSDETHGVRVYDLAETVTHLKFTVEGIVAAASGDYLTGRFVGLTKQQVRLQCGEPSRIELKEFETVYHYTAPAKSGTYKRREVHFDVDNKVRSVVAEMYYD